MSPYYFGISNANSEGKDANTNPNYKGFPTIAILIFLVVMDPWQCMTYYYRSLIHSRILQHGMHMISIIIHFFHG